MALHWAWLAGVVVVSAWVWEDAAVIFAALLAMDQSLSLGAALVASFVGIASGDLGLYLLGRFGRRWRWVRGWLARSGHTRRLRRRFRQRTLSNIFIIRFIPGLRTLGFTLCGLWRVPAARFAWAMVLAGVVWIALVFVLIGIFGLSDALRESPWRWTLMAVALAALVFNNWWAARVAKTPLERKLNGTESRREHVR